jgi:hypothetical protein
VSRKISRPKKDEVIEQIKLYKKEIHKIGKSRIYPGSYNGLGTCSGWEDKECIQNCNGENFFGKAHMED